jgi:hypothetical protein
MAKKQKSFADKASGNKETDAVYVKYVKSVKSEKTGRWRFNEQMIRTKKGEQLDVALKRLNQVANLVDIDLSEFIVTDTPVEETLEETPTDNTENTSNETTDQESNTEEGISESEVKEQDIAKDPEPSATSEPSDTEGSSKEE